MKKATSIVLGAIIVSSMVLSFFYVEATRSDRRKLFLLKHGQSPEYVARILGDASTKIEVDPGNNETLIQTFGLNPVFALIPTYQYTAQFNREGQLKNVYWKRVSFLSESMGKADIASGQSGWHPNN